MKIKIHDSTLRDGNHAAKHSLPLGIVENHCNLADRAGIYSVEVGHGNGLGASSFQVGLVVFSRTSSSICLWLRSLPLSFS